LLRDLKLEGRLLQHPLSWMFYTPMFDALPDAARTRVRERLTAVLAGTDTHGRYAHHTPALLLPALPVHAQHADTPRVLAAVDGGVSGATQIGRRLFVAGTFDHVSPPTGGAVIVDVTGPTS